ncbi:MAG: lytic transglycosylase domain-containing protein [bacterium]
MFGVLIGTAMIVGCLEGNDMVRPLSVPEGLEERVEFWLDVFTKYSNRHRIIHDAEKPDRIYRIFNLSTSSPYPWMTKEQEAEFVKEEAERVASILKKLSENDVKEEELTEEESRIYRLFGDQPDKKALHAAAERVHVQNGMRETFEEGLARSICYLDTIRHILRAHGLPEDFAYLPHIESSFHPEARSKDGAVGLWQFTKAAGKQYLTIQRGVDERTDPVLSTEAAAKHLKENFRVLGSWPLAVTAYNCGLNRVLNAVRKLRTKEVVRIVEEYRSRRFAYASQNFYAEFLAAVHIAKHPFAYFGRVSSDSPMRVKVISVQYPYVSDSMQPVDKAR